MKSASWIHTFRTLATGALVLALLLAVTPGAQAQKLDSESVSSSAEELSVPVASIQNCVGQVEGEKALYSSHQALASLALEPQPMASESCESTCTGYCGAGGCCSCFCGGFFNYCYWYCCSNSPENPE